MSTLADRLAITKAPELLIEISFTGGLIWRVAKRRIAVPYSGGDPRIFDILLGSDITVTTTLDLDSLRYSLHVITCEVSNRDRLHDYEASHNLDGGQARVYLWTDGLDWANIVSDGLIAEGTFYKLNHDRTWYRFQIVDELAASFKPIPGTSINVLTWPDHRLTGGAGSVAGKAQQIVFGDWTKGIPLLCVVNDAGTPSYKYLACLGKTVSVDADYTAGTVDVYDKDGAVVPVANYTFYPSVSDFRGNTVAVFDFGSNDMEASEPLSCSIKGIIDDTGIITGDAGALIEHPAEIIYYLLQNYSNVPLARIDLRSIKTMRSLLPGLNMRIIINDQAQAVELMDRLLGQCVCARLHRGGKVGIFTFNPAGPIVATFRDADVNGLPTFSKTPITKVLTALEIKYAWNPTTDQWEGNFFLDQSNHAVLHRAYLDYGAQVEGLLELRDIGDEATARYAANRYIAFYGMRHDIVELSLPYHLIADVREGDMVHMSLADAAAADHAGWIDHPVLLVEREFGPRNVRTKWLNPRLIELAISGEPPPPSGEFGITTEAGEVITTEAGETIITEEG